MKSKNNQTNNTRVVANTLQAQNVNKSFAVNDFTALKALQEKAKLLGKSYQYGGYKGL